MILFDTFVFKIFKNMQKKLYIKLTFINMLKI